MADATEQEKTTSDNSSVVYLGHIPDDFEELQMRKFFSQFGTLKHAKLSRNPKTGASRHYGFMEFESPEVAEIVANTMNNYMLFGRKLICQVKKVDELDKDLWLGERKKFSRDRMLNQRNEKIAKQHLSEMNETGLRKFIEHRLESNKKILGELDKMNVTYELLNQYIKEDTDYLATLPPVNEVKEEEKKEEKKEEEKKEEKKEKAVVKRISKKAKKTMN